MTVRVRFAPAPTGDLHEGGALVAVANHLLRRREGGVLILRIDDTDAERLDPAAETRIAADLAWLGIIPDEGPDAGPYAPYRQSERADRHRAAAERLVAAGAAERGPDGAVFLAAPTADVVVPDLSRGPIRIPADELGPTVLVRADGRPTYHLATAVDDHELGITHVLRGEDHLVNSARQLALCAALGVAPPAFAHLPIVVGAAGGRLSSRSGALGIGRLRDAGHLPEAVADWLARSACPPLTALPASELDALAAAFDPTRLGHGTTHLDPVLLAALGRDHLARLEPAERARRIAAWMGEEADATAIAALAPGLTDAATLAEAEAAVRGVLDAQPLATAGEADRAAAAALIAALPAAPDPLDATAAEGLIAALGCGKRPLRRVLTATDSGIPLPFVLAALPRATALARARAVLDQP
ncbi:MAG: glutamate--tRNA ligase [Gaiellales bacterium]